MSIKLSDYVIKYLEQIGTKHMFMLPGGGAMHLNDSLGKSKEIQFVCCLHEQACSIAAEAYSRITNKPGLLMVTTGPGGTNALTGIAAAFIESTPIIVISGQVKQLDQIRDQHIRQQGMQELDIISVVKPITKYAVMITEPHSIKYHLDKALYEAVNGRKGPVWIDIPLDVQATMIDEERLYGYEEPVQYYDNLDKKIADVIDVLNKSERPVLLAGNGIRIADAIPEFQELVKVLNIPVLTSWNGIDLIEEENPLYYGRPGGLGHRYANFIQQNSDMFLSIGARLNLLQTGYNFDGFAREAKKIMVDIDRNEMHKINVRPDVTICSDAKQFIVKLLENKDKIVKKDRKPWFDYADRLYNKYPLIPEEYWNQKEKVNTYCLIETISKNMKAEDIYVAGSSGSCIEISMQTFKVKKDQRVFTTKGLASMGYGVPSTIGASLAGNRAKTVCVNGDGGFQMNIQELQTIRRLNLPIKIFVLNNSGYAAIKGTQTNLFNGNLVACNEESGLSMPNLEDIAKAYKIRSVTINNNDELDAKVKEALEGDDPVICNVIVPIELKVLPKQISYKRQDGQMESFPLEYLAPQIPEEEFKENMLIPIYDMK